jgi:hypothetical protein
MIRRYKERWRDIQQSRLVTGASRWLDAVGWVMLSENPCEYFGRINMCERFSSWKENDGLAVQARQSRNCTEAIFYFAWRMSDYWPL